MLVSMYARAKQNALPLAEATLVARVARRVAPLRAVELGKAALKDGPWDAVAGDIDAAVGHCAVLRRGCMAQRELALARAD